MAGDVGLAGEVGAQDLDGEGPPGNYVADHSRGARPRGWRGRRRVHAEGERKSSFVAGRVGDCAGHLVRTDPQRAAGGDEPT